MIKITLEIDSNDIQKLNIPNNVWEILASNGQFRVKNTEHRTEHHKDRRTACAAGDRSECLRHAKTIDKHMKNTYNGYLEENEDSTDGAVGQILEVLRKSKHPLTAYEIANKVRYSYKYIQNLIYTLRKDGMLDRIYDNRKRGFLYAIKGRVGRREFRQMKQYKQHRANSCSPHAKQKVMNALLSTNRPLTRDDLIEVCDYAYSYIKLIIRDLREAGLIETIVEKAKHFYKPTEKAEKSQEYQAA